MSSTVLRVRCRRDRASAPQAAPPVFLTTQERCEACPFLPPERRCCGGYPMPGVYARGNWPKGLLTTAFAAGQTPSVLGQRARLVRDDDGDLHAVLVWWRQGGASFAIRAGSSRKSSPTSSGLRRVALEDRPSGASSRRSRCAEATRPLPC